MTMMIVNTACEFSISDIFGNGLLLLSGDPGDDATWDTLVNGPRKVRRVVRCLREAKHTTDLTLCHHVPIDDIPLVPIHNYFAAATDFMEDSINDGHATLVHCAAGVSRSVSIVLAYLVIKRNMSLADSIAMVRAARPIMNPNLGFLRQLITRPRWRAVLCRRRPLSLMSTTWRR